MTCRPLITHHDGRYTAWCRPCGWESAPYHFTWQARDTARAHTFGDIWDDDT